MWTAHHSPKATNHLLVVNRDQLLENILGALTHLKKHFGEFLESRRISFPRFFLISDPQLLDFLSAVHLQEQFDKHISCVFPAVSQLYIRDTREMYDLNAPLFDLYSDNVNHLLGHFEVQLAETGIVPVRTDNRAEEHNMLLPERGKNEQSEGCYPFEVLGMIGINHELLLFREAVAIHSSVEKWISEVETMMKISLQHALTRALNTFTTMSIDDWVQDFPLQVIFTSLYLILTHELTELIMERDRKGSDTSSILEDAENSVPDDHQDYFNQLFFPNDLEEGITAAKLQVMSFIQHRSCKGLGLRLQFWTYQLIRALSADSNSRLTSLNSMTIQNVIHFLCYQRDLIDNIIENKLHSTRDFEWQKLLRMY